MLFCDEINLCSVENVEFENFILFYSICRVLDARETSLFLSDLILMTSREARTLSISAPFFFMASFY